MNEAQLRRIIREEIALQQIVTSGATESNTLTTEDIASLLPGLPTITGRPIMFPFGLVSRAPKGTISVTAQQGQHPANKFTLGHRYARPPSVDVGESAVYSLGGYVVKLGNGSVSIGKGSTFETAVVGETLVTFLKAVLDAIIAHDHVGNLGFPTSPPKNVADFQAAKANFVDNNKILAKDGGRF